MNLQVTALDCAETATNTGDMLSVSRNMFIPLTVGVDGICIVILSMRC